MTDWQDITQWQAPPLVAGNFAVTGAFQTLVPVGALGSYQNMLCYVSPGGASNVQLTFIHTLADTGAGVVSFSRSVICQAGMGSIFTVPALTNQVRITALSNVNVSADIAIWPTNHERAYGTPYVANSIYATYNQPIGIGALVIVPMPVYAGRCRLVYQMIAGPSAISLQTVDVAGANTMTFVNETVIAAGVVVDKQVDLPLSGCTFAVLNNSGAATTWSANIVPDLAM